MSLMIKNNQELPDGFYILTVIVGALVSFFFSVGMSIAIFDSGLSLLWLLSWLTMLIPVFFLLFSFGEPGERIGYSGSKYNLWEVQKTYPKNLGIRKYSVDEIMEISDKDAGLLYVEAEKMMTAYRSANMTDISSTLSEIRQVTQAYEETASKMKELA